jgi:hypothetical protein
LTEASAEQREVNDDEVDAFISTWAEIGDRKESGTFTIARDRAWSQLGKLQLPFEEAWVLKLVQSAVRGKVVRLDVRQSRQGTTFVFEGVTHWNCQQVENSIFELEGARPPDLDHLSLALRHLLHCGRHFTITYCDKVAARWNGSCFEYGSSPRCAGFRLSVSHERDVVVRLESTDFAASIARALTLHCAFSPVPIIVDGRSICGPEQDPAVGLTPHRVPLAFRRLPNSANLPELSFGVAGIENRFGPQNVSVVSDPDTVVKPAGVCPGGVVFTLQLDAEQLGPVKRVRSEIIWILDGVIVEREPFPIDSLVTVGAVVSASGLQTDLSTLRLRPDEARERRRLSTLKAIIASLESHPLEFTCDTAPPVRLTWWNGIVLTVYWIVNVSLGFSLTMGKVLLEMMSSTAGRDALLVLLKDDQEQLIRGLRSHLKLLEKS